VVNRNGLADGDPRHGTNAGYVAGCRCEPCNRGRLRQQKAHRLAVLNGKRSFYPNDEVRQLIDPWLRLGLSVAAIQKAAGLSSDKVKILHNPVRPATFHALAAVTEDAFDAKSFVHADLTRRRIYSLQAAGHRLNEMPINPRGRWRDRPRITVGTARAIRDHYRALEFVPGTDRHTATRALNAGHVVPMAWDDPDTLAWPSGKPERIVVASARPRKTDVDHAAVERALRYDFSQVETMGERIEITRRWEALGRSLAELERVSGWKADRYVVRDGAA